MTTTATKKARAVSDQVLAAVGQAQGSVVKAVATASGFVGGYLPQVRRIEIPSSVPTSREVIREVYSFADKVLGMQKRYALDLVEATEPVWTKLIKHDTPAPRKASKAA